MNRRNVIKARHRIEAGSYDYTLADSDVFDHLNMDALVDNLNRCPPRNGKIYRDAVTDVLAGSLSYVVDVPLMRQDFPIEGGRADLELPLRKESMGGCFLWQDWCRRYDVTSLIVEVKNMTKHCSVEDVRQIKGYLGDGCFGRLGFLVSRSGFASGATKNLIATAKDGRFLILPFSHEDLIGLANASKKGPVNSMRFLRRAETLLLQSAR